MKNATPSINDIRHNNSDLKKHDTQRKPHLASRVVMLSAALAVCRIFKCYAERRYDEHRYAEHHYDECHYAERR